VSEPRLVALTLVMSTFAAEAIKGALEAADIPAMTQPEQHGGWLFPGAGGGLGLVAVLVEADRLDEAKAVLVALEEADGGEGEAQPS
jgi:hypothetical protein